MDLCTICLQKGHVAANCPSPMAQFLSGSGHATAGRVTSSKEEKVSTQSTSAGGTTSSFPLLAEYQPLVDQAIDALGTEQAVCRWLGYERRGIVALRLKYPHRIRREHISALELLLERVNRKEP